MDRIARGLHTLKGTSATVGLEELSSVAHAMEDLIAPLKKSGAKLSPKIVDVLLRTLDGVLERVQARGSGREMASSAPLLAALSLVQGQAAPNPFQEVANLSAAAPVASVRTLSPMQSSRWCSITRPAALSASFLASS